MVWRNRIAHRRLALEIGHDRIQVVVGEPLHLHEWKERAPVMTDAEAKGAGDCAVCDVPQPGLGVRGQVSRVELAGRYVEYDAANQRHVRSRDVRLVLRGVTVARGARRRIADDVVPAFDDRRIGRRRRLRVGRVEGEVLARRYERRAASNEHQDDDAENAKELSHSEHVSGCGERTKYPATGFEGKKSRPALSPSGSIGRRRAVNRHPFTRTYSLGRSGSGADSFRYASTPDQSRRQWRWR